MKILQSYNEAVVEVMAYFEKEHVKTLRRDLELLRTSSEPWQRGQHHLQIVLRGGPHPVERRQ